MRGEQVLRSAGTSGITGRKRNMQAYEIGEDYILRKKRKKQRRTLRSFQKKLQKVQREGRVRHRRRRRSAGLLVILTILIIFLFSRSLSFAHEALEQKSMVPQRYYKSITVKDGDTLWGIAKRYLPEDYESLEEYVYTLMRLNNLQNSRIEAGQQIIIVYNNTSRRM